MSDTTTTPTSPPAPAPPPSKGNRRGRKAGPADNSNSEFANFPEVEYFIAPGPRGYPPLTGEGQILSGFKETLKKILNGVRFENGTNSSSMKMSKAT